MRILVHDYAGHPFQVQLSRALAGAGHTVTHLYASFFQTPHGALTRKPADAPQFSVRGVNITTQFTKHSFFRRRFQEVEYGTILVREVEAFKPDVVISANTPLDPQKAILETCRRRGIRFIFWLQDAQGLAMMRLLPKRLPILGHAVGWHYRRLEHRIALESDHVVAITEDFRPLLRSWGVPDSRISGMENWAPLDEVQPCQKDNNWSRAQHVADKFCILYSGTLGMKHNPNLLLRLACEFRHDDNIRVVVISEGPAAAWLTEKKRQLQLANLQILGFQPFEIMAQVLGAADVLAAILEPDAGMFSVPSKVLTYLCAERPLLLAVPTENLAARIVTTAGAGVVVRPDDEEGFVREARGLLESPTTRNKMAARGRSYAAQTFDIVGKRKTFEAIFSKSQ